MNHITPNEWALCEWFPEGDHKHYNLIFEGTYEECKDYATHLYDNPNLCLLDSEGREWEA